MATPAVLTTSGVSTSGVWVANIHNNPSQIAIGLVITPAATCTVQVTYDNPLSATFNPATATWFSSSVSAVTTNTDAVINSPVRGIRLNQTAGAGSAALTIIQAGLAGN